MFLSKILNGDVPTFLENSYQKAPVANPSVANGFLSLMTWDVFFELAPLVPARDILVVKNGKLFPELAPRSREELATLHRTGHSIVLRHTERFDRGLACVGEDFAYALHGSVVIQVYSTPAGFHSFGWHYDAEEVFIIQTCGEKHYYLRENTINPHPTLATMPENMEFERETSPLIGATLVPGDFLYVPGGWWHVARAEKDSLSLSIGVTSRRLDLAQAVKSFGSF